MIDSKDKNQPEQAGENIIIRNNGPIIDAAIPARPGHITVLKGVNGSGKTHALNAIRAISSGKDKNKLPLRDGTKKGVVEFGGARISIGRVNRATGEADIVGVESNFKIEDLVSPGLKSDEAADAKSIKALINLLSPTVSFSMFAHLIPEEKVDDIISEAARECDDLVKMAAQVKRDIEAEARRLEKAADNHQQNAILKAKGIEGIDLEQESNPIQLQADLEAKIRELSDLQNQSKTAEKAKQDREKAESDLKQFLEETDKPGMTLEQAENDVLQKSYKIDDINKDIEETEARLRELNRDLKAAQGDHQDSEAHRDAIAAYEKTVAHWQGTIENTQEVPAPTADEITEAEIALDAARAAHDEGVRIRDAKKTQAEIDEEREKAKRLERQAQEYREAAKATDDVLSDVIAESGSSLQVEIIDGETRLYLQTDRGQEYYRELSEGERWLIALNIAIEALKKLPAEYQILVISQEAWEALDYHNKGKIAKAIEGTGVSIFTAEASRPGDPDELTPVVADVTA